MSELVKNIFRGIFFIAIQVFVLSRVTPLSQYITPYIYFLFLLWLPYSINRWLLLVLGFAYGLTLDSFLGYAGLHAAPCTLIAYLRPFLINLFIAQETTEQNYIEPSIKSMGATPYAIYITLLTIIHHTLLVLIEWLQFGSFFYFALKVIATTVISLLLILITELLFYRKAKYRTNTA
jgi:hypothetical protein